MGAASVFPGCVKIRIANIPLLRAGPLEPQSQAGQRVIAAFDFARMFQPCADRPSFANVPTHIQVLDHGLFYFGRSLGQLCRPRKPIVKLILAADTHTRSHSVRLKDQFSFLKGARAIFQIAVHAKNKLGVLRAISSNRQMEASFCPGAGLIHRRPNAAQGDGRLICRPRGTAIA